MTLGRFGIARMSAALENITTSPTRRRPRMMAVGTLRSGSSTSSAIDPAASKPRNDQPTNAIASSMGPDDHEDALGSPALENRVENEFSLKNSSSTAPRPTDAMTSQVMLAMTMIFKTFRPTMLTALPTAMMPTATPPVCHRPASLTPKICRRNPLAAYDRVLNAMGRPQ